MQNQNVTDVSFLEEMGDVKPLNQDKINTHSAARSLDTKKRDALVFLQQKNPNNPLSLEGVKPVKPDDFLVFKQSGIQEGVFKNLRLGKYHIDQKLTLAGLTLKESANTLYETLQSSHAKGHRAVLIHHGRGENSQPFKALKKSYVQHWLLEIEEVIAFHSAVPAHGGLAATYALLKKHPEQKLINRENNRRR